MSESGKDGHKDASEHSSQGCRVPRSNEWKMIFRELPCPDQPGVFVTRGHLFISRDISEIPSTKCLVSEELESIDFETGAKIESIGQKVFEGSAVKVVKFPASMKKLGQRAFYGCKKLAVVQFQAGSHLSEIQEGCFVECILERIIIPASVQMIGNRAFGQCSALSVVEFEHGSQLLSIGNEAFGFCSFAKFILPASVTSVGGSAFSACNIEDFSLEHGNTRFSLHGSLLLSADGKRIVACYGRHVSIPATVEEIGEWAFYSHGDNVEKILIPKTVKAIRKSAFSRSIFHAVEFEANSQLEVIGESGFKYTRTKKITIPASVKVMDDEAFHLSRLNVLEFEANSQLEVLNYGVFYGIRITTVTIPANIKRIKRCVFDRCRDLKVVRFEDGSRLKSVGYSAFSGTAIRDITFPASLQKMDDRVFAHCKLRNVNVEKGNRHFRSNGGTLVSVRDYVCCVGSNLSCLETIPQDVYTHSDIRTFTVPATVKSIKARAFEGCHRLKVVNFEAGSVLKSIGSLAFRHTAIKTIKIPASVTEIKNDAFTECNMDNIFVEGGNKVYVGHGCLLLSADRKTLVACAGSNTPLPRSVENIDPYGFAGSTIERFTVPASYTSIPEGAFENSAIKVVKFEIGTQLVSIRKNAFHWARLKSVVIPASVEEICDHGFLCSRSLEVVEFEAGSRLVSIGDEAFMMTKIKRIAIPAGVRAIQRETFSFCENLEVVEFEAGSQLVSIGVYAFKNTKIKTMTIPVGVEEICEMAFIGCKRLESVHFEAGARLRLLNQKAFSGSAIKMMSVPVSIKEICWQAMTEYDIRLVVQ